MSDEKMARMVLRLYARTESGDVAWEAATKPDTFQAAFPDYAVLIAENFDPDEGACYELSIYNSTGTLVDSVTAAHLAFEGAHETMQALYSAARRQALGIETALDAILEALDPDTKEGAKQAPSKEDDLPF